MVRYLNNLMSKGRLNQRRASTLFLRVLVLVWAFSGFGRAGLSEDSAKSSGFSHVTSISAAVESFDGIDRSITRPGPLEQPRVSSLKRHISSQFISRGSALTGSQTFAATSTRRQSLSAALQYLDHFGVNPSAPRAPPSIAFC